MKVNEIMEGDVRTCGPDDTLEFAALLMWDSDCGSVAVVNQAGAPVGIITDRDIAMSCALNHKSLLELHVKDVTNNRPLYTCLDTDDVRDALDAMKMHKIRRLPVMNTAGNLRGIISIDDIVVCSEDKVASPSLRDTMKTLKAVCIHH